MATLPIGAVPAKYNASSRLLALNRSAPESAYLQFKRCCGSSSWSRKMTQARPFTGIQALMDFADLQWSICSRNDCLEAFAAHPRIGEPGNTLWSRMEQSCAQGVSAQVRAALVQSNKAYEARFGYIFIVCASDKSAEEILTILRQRLRNSPLLEIRNAAEQQRLITRLRLAKLLTE